MLKDAQAAASERTPAACRSILRLALVGGSLCLLTGVLGCKATPLDQWRAMSSSRLEPLTERQVAALDDWHRDEPVTTVVRAGEVR
jgi:hypothetical protein